MLDSENNGGIKQVLPQAVKKNDYMPGIDGLRTFAVFAVIFYHFGFSRTPGGYLGVTLFFVLSGYLITDLLLRERDDRGCISLARFWTRRAKRLLPGLFVLLIILSAWVALFRRDLANNLRADILPAVLYYSNWQNIIHKVSYFEKFGTPPLLNHLWSLAVEEQFYILWPLLLLAGIRLFGARRRRLAAAILFGALLSAGAMALLYRPGEDPSRVYYGSDTRAFALLLGAAAAVVLPSRTLLAAQLTKGRRAALETGGLLGLAGVTAFIVFCYEYSGFLYRGGMLLFSVLCVPLIFAAARPETLLARFFTLPPLRKTGAFCYEIYLIQFPVIALTTPAVNTSGNSLCLRAEQTAFILLAAWLVYRFIDNPIRFAGTRRLSKPAEESASTAGRRRLIRYGAACALSGALLVANVSAASSLFHIVPDNYEQGVTNLLPAANAAAERDGEPSVVSKPDAATAAPSPEEHASPWQRAAANSPRIIASSPPYESGKILSKKRITVLGDSIMYDVGRYLKPGYPNMDIRFEVGFQIWNAKDLIIQIKKEGRLGDIVVIELGTNGTCPKKMLLSLVREIGAGRKVIFCNTRIPNPWGPAINRNMRDVVLQTPGTLLADWYAVSANHDEYFCKDGVHTVAAGAKAYAAMLQSAIQKAETAMTD